MTDLLEDLLDHLTACEIDYMVVGSVSSGIYGQARATQDLDVVVDLQPESLARLLSRLPESRYYCSVEAAREAVRRKTQFNAIDLVGGGKVDLIVLKSRAFSHSEFRRRRKVHALDRELFVASCEDVILSKLEWNRISPSERQLRDVAGIFQVQRGNLDFEYLNHWARELDVADELERLSGI